MKKLILAFLVFTLVAKYSFAQSDSITYDTSFSNYLKWHDCEVVLYSIPVDISPVDKKINQNDFRLDISASEKESLGFRKIHMYNWGKKRILYTLKPNSTTFHRRHKLMNISLEINYEDRWLTFQKTYIPSSKNNYQKLKLKRNQKMAFEISTFSFQKGDPYTARVCYKNKGQNYYSNHFELMLTSEQIESALNFRF